MDNKLKIRNENLKKIYPTGGQFPSVYFNALIHGFAFSGVLASLMLFIPALAFTKIIYDSNGEEKQVVDQVSLAYVYRV